MGYDLDRAIRAPRGSSARSPTASASYAALGLAEVQLVVDPITIESIEALAPVLADLDRG